MRFLRAHTTALLFLVLAVLSACFAPVTPAHAAPIAATVGQADRFATLTQDSLMPENTTSTTESAATRKFDEVQPGGRYITEGGIVRDAEGKILDESVDSAAAAPTPSSTPDSGGAASVSSTSTTGDANANTNTPNKSRSELEAMDKADLQALAEQEQLTVEGTGANGNVLKTDLIDALATKYGS